MNDPIISEADIEVVIDRIEDFASQIPNAEMLADSRPIAMKVIDCVLSLRTRYDRVVVPRLRVFRNKHPNIQNVTDLVTLIASYPSSFDFIQKELNFNSERKARILQQVSKYVSQIVQKTPDISEEESLRNWALQAKPQECYALNIKGFKLAGFQYLRMLFGADTTKPDKHTREFLSDVLNRNVSAIEAILLLEAVSKRVEFSVRALDSFIWNRGARSDEMADGTERNDELSPEYDETRLKNGTRGKYAEQYAAETNIVRLDSNVAAAFPNEKAVNEALRSLLKEKNKEK